MVSEVRLASRNSRGVWVMAVIWLANVGHRSGTLDKCGAITLSSTICSVHAGQNLSMT